MSNCCDSGTCPKCAETRKRFAKLAGAYLAKNKPTYEQLTAENSRLRKAIEEADMHFDGCSVYLKEPCDCGFDEWKRNALEGKE